MKTLLDKAWVRYVSILLIGIAIGAIFYPSKTITREETFQLKEKIERLETEKRNVTSFYEKRLDTQSAESRTREENITKKVDTLKEENFSLKQKVSEKRFKIVRPDGTIEEKWFKDSETNVISSTVTKIKSEFTRKVTEIENKWKTIHEQRVSKIKEKFEKQLAESRLKEVKATKKEKIEINKRSFGVSLGLTTDDSYFSSVSYDIFGPVFLDLHLESKKDFSEKEAGIGIGLRF